MGLRANVIKKYEIEYGDSNGFNYGAYTLHNLIESFCYDYYAGGDEYGGCNTDVIWEVNKEEFRAMLDEIKEMKDEEFKKYLEIEIDREEAVRVLEGFLNETPEDSNYVRFAWL